MFFLFFFFSQGLTFWPKKKKTKINQISFLKISKGMKTTMQSSTKDVSFKWNTLGFRPQTQKLERQIHDLADVVLNERY